MTPPVNKQDKDVMVPMFDAVEALNTLRNRLAHNLEPKDVMPLLKKLHVINKDGAVSLSSKSIISDLNLTLAALTGYIGGLGDRARKARNDPRSLLAEVRVQHGKSAVRDRFQLRLRQNILRHVDQAVFVRKRLVRRDWR
jgi:DNA-binding protein